MASEDDKVKVATALQREQADALTVVAQGSGALANRIMELAHKHKVPVLQDFLLSERLSQVPPGSRIPDHVFAALATVLDFLQQEDRLAAEQHPPR